MFEDPAKQGVELLRSIAAASQDHRPILFSARGLHIVGQNSGFHCINITGLTQEKDPQTGEVKTFLVFKDTRGPKFPLDLQRTQGISVEDAHRNTYRVEAGIFLRDYANFAMIVNRPTQGIDPDVIKGIDPQRLWEVVNQNKYTVGEIILTQMTELDKEAVIKVTPIEKKSGSEERDSREEKYRARREDELRALARQRIIKSRFNLDKEDKIRV